MRYRLRYKEREEEISATGPEDNRLFTVGDRRYNTSVTRISHELLLLKIDGKHRLVFVAGEGDDLAFLVRGRCYCLKEATGGSRRTRREAEEHAREVTPPMPSVVVKILVSEGEEVQKGQGLMVVSAMKMETTLRAPYSGIVNKIKTSVNARVAPGDILVEITPLEEANG